MANSPLRDRIDGGFFRYATRRDWSEPHYERMLYDNAQLLRLYSQVGNADVATGIEQFLTSTMRLASGLFASAQDSESHIGGARSEGGYYQLTARERAAEQPPSLDGKALSGWNGLAIRAYAEVGSDGADPALIAIARDTADSLLRSHIGADGRLARASFNGVLSSAPATLEDYGLVAEGLLSLSLAVGDPKYASAARRLVDLTLTDHGCSAPGGGDPVLRAKGLPRIDIPSEGASPSGQSVIVGACLSLYEITGDRRYRTAAEQTLAPLRDVVLATPSGFGALLTAFARLHDDLQIVLISPAAPQHNDALVLAAVQSLPSQQTRAYRLSESEAQLFAEAGFDLFSGRTAQGGNTTAYLCRNGVCFSPTQSPDDLIRVVRENARSA